MLMSNYLESIRNQEDLRKTLIDLRNVIREEEQQKALAYELAGDFSAFTELLHHEDPKVRKNAVLILGEMECDDLCETIWKAYEEEKTLFVKADYLRGLAHCDCRALLPRMKERMNLLTHQTVLPEEEKHYRNEVSALQTLILKNDKTRHHKFIGQHVKHEIILMTNRNHREITAQQLGDREIRFLAGGVKLESDNLDEIQKIRTYSELLFAPPETLVLDGSPDHMAKQLTSRWLMDFLDENHEGGFPFYFRLEIRSGLNQEQKVDLVKKMSLALERETERRLVNATSGYEVEIRLVANKMGRFIPLVKLFTMADWRFAYRKEALPTSIAPVNAALTMALAKNYLKENAQVLDPFCGTGTMLIERAKMTMCGSIYGLDILEDAISKARKNTEFVRLPIHYINRNYFNFKHDYLFDEIISNLPATGKNRDLDSIRVLYEKFLKKSEEHLKNNAILVLYTPHPEALVECVKRNSHYRIQEEFVINEREGSHVLVLSYQDKVFAEVF